MKQRRYKLKRHYTELGRALSEGRRKAGLTQRDVSISLGYSSAQFISNFEQGICPPPIHKLRHLLKTYRMSAGLATKLILAGVEKKITEELYG